MNKLILKIFALFFFTPLFLLAKTTPGEGSQLNYRMIGFSFPGMEQIINYKLQLAAGNYTTEKAFRENIIVTIAAKKNKIVTEVPAFGMQYTWRVLYVGNGSKTSKSELHHFSTMMSPYVDPDSVRMRITCPSGKYKDHYVFVDGNKVLYDMNGKPVWFFPKIENQKPGSIHLRDLKITQFGTITSIVNGRLYEISYNGDILWQGPQNNEISLDTMTPDRGYHHEFTRLANGHYMAMGFEEPYWQLPQPPDSSVYALWASKIKHDSNNVYYQKMFFSTILEYDGKGNIVWKWSDADYFKTSDLHTRMLDCKLFDLNDTHANALYFDEHTENLYISYRELSRIIQVQYPGRIVLHTYGKRYIPGAYFDRHMSNGMFCCQHSCRLSDEGYLYLFNNNTCHRRSLPSILMLKEPQPGKDTLEKIWEFECPMDGQDEQPITGLFNFGGNVSELPDRNLFVCMGGSYGKLFIVNRGKKILWSSQPEKWDMNTNQWIKDGLIIDNKIKEGSYRASIINREQLESIIWNEPLKK